MEAGEPDPTLQYGLTCLCCVVVYVDGDASGRSCPESQNLGHGNVVVPSFP